eukprot:1889181-Pleurochrysis_carterae.AAC.1
MFRAPCALSKPSITATAPTKYQYVSMASQITLATRRRNVLRKEEEENGQLHRKYVINCIGRCRPSVVASRLALSPLTTQRRAPSLTDRRLA